MTEGTSTASAPPTEKASEKARRRALVKASPMLQPYGTFDEVAELVKRFKVMVPETADMTPEECVAFAQVAYAFQLNPLPAVREIAWLPGKGPMVTARGLRRKGREWAEERELGQPDLDHTVITDAVERELRRIPEGALAIRVEGCFPEARARYAQDAKTMREALGPDAPYQVILDSIGPRPNIIGWGYLTKQEMIEKDTQTWWHKCPAANWKRVSLRGDETCTCGKASTGPSYSHMQHAMKRAESHWWKQATDIPFAVTPAGDGVADLSDVPIEGEFSEMAAGGTGAFADMRPEDLEGASPDQIEAHMQQKAQEHERTEQRAAMTPEERKATAQAASDDLFGAEPAAQAKVQPVEPRARMWSDAFADRVERLFVGNGIMPPGDHRKHLIMLLNLSPFDEAGWDDADIIAWGKAYRGARDQDVPSKAAAAMATAAVPAPF